LTAAAAVSASIACSSDMRSPIAYSAAAIRSISPATSADHGGRVAVRSSVTTTRPMSASAAAMPACRRPISSTRRCRCQAGSPGVPGGDTVWNAMALPRLRIPPRANHRRAAAHPSN
jgi:hypothetical protein